MSSPPNLRTSLTYVLVYSLVVTSLITITSRPSEASRNLLPTSLTPTLKASSEETAPQLKTVDEAARSRVHEAFGKLPLSFEENRGQVDEQVKFLSRGRGYTLFLTPTEAVLSLRQGDAKKGRATTADTLRSHVPAQPRPTRTSVVRMKLSGANTAPALTGESEMGVKTNYFRGNDPKKWQAGVSRYERVRYAQVYPGIDMIYYGRQQQLEYDFEVAPGADASQIALEYEGVKGMKVERKTGDLVLKTAGGEVRQHKPVSYQEVGGERREVASRYVMQGERNVRIEVEEYDRTKPLVIDPVLSYSTYLGGDDYDFISAIAVDASGHAYVTGTTYSSNFPTVNEYQTLQDDYYEGNDANAFVAKLDTNASGAASLLYSTYLSGEGTESFPTGNLNDFGNGIAVDSAGIVYVTGTTQSLLFPTTTSDGPVCLNGSLTEPRTDAFVTQLDTNASGAASLLYSECVGGSDDDEGNDIAIDAAGNIYLTGFTGSDNFPTHNGFQTNQEDGEFGLDAFVIRLNPNTGSSYSTYLGGNGYDYGTGIAVDSSGNAYVTGDTSSTNFPTLNKYQGDRAGYDVFVTKINTYGSGASALLYSTYLGGNGSEDSYDIAVDDAGHAYVTGDTASTNFPTFHQYQTDRAGTDAFVTKFDTNASGTASLLYSTYLGGNNYDAGVGIAVDAAGHTYVTGGTSSTNFPTLNKYQGDRAGYDAFVTKINTNASGASALLYSTYLGGNGSESGYNIAVDDAGHAYVAGGTTSTNFPTLHQYQENQIEDDAFITKLTDTNSISGRVTSDGTTGLGGVTMYLKDLSGVISTATTDDGGHYKFDNLLAGSGYTVVPRRIGYEFNPVKHEIPSLYGDQTVNFIATAASYLISGRITKAGTTTALEGLTVKLSGSHQMTTTTNANGVYRFEEVPAGGFYTVVPVSAYYNFTPQKREYLNLSANQLAQNYAATLKTFTISGVVKLGAGTLAGVEMKLSSPTPAGFAPRTVYSNSEGRYAFTNVPAGRNYTVTATKAGYQFTQPSIVLPNLSADHPAVNFTVKVYSISGRVTRTGTTTGIGLVTMTLTSPTPSGFAARTVKTSADGNYTFANLPAGRNYTIKPTKSGFTFSPTTRQITNLSNNIPAGASTNFKGTGP